MSTFSTYDSTVNSFYLAFYGRPADPAGLKFWSQQLADNNGELGAITQAFATSEEAQVRFGTDSVNDRIAEIYQQLFNHTPDAAGLAYWTGVIEQGHASMADVAVAILGGAKDSDATLSQLRQQAADAFTAQVEASGSQYDGYASIEAARILVRAVTPDATAADLDVLVKAAVSFADTATKTPQVVEAIAVNTTLLALFDTARGTKEPVALAKALADTAKAAAGDPVTLESLLRGGGMDKVLKVMPAKATLVDVVDALAKGGLPAAVEVVYPTAPTAPGGIVKPAPLEPITFQFLGVQQGDGDTSTDNVTSVAKTPVIYVYEGRELTRDEHFQYRLNGGEWTDANLKTGAEKGYNMIAITEVDLSKGTPVKAGEHADRSTILELRAIDANGKTTAISTAQELVYDNYVAAPMLALEKDTASKFIGSSDDKVTSVGVIEVTGVDAGDKIEYMAVAKQAPSAFPMVENDSDLDDNDSGNDNGNVDADADKWSPTAPELVEGENTVRVRVTDKAGNTNENSITFTYDSKAPEAPTVTLAKDTGVAGDRTTSDATLKIGNLEKTLTGAWQYSQNGGATWLFGDFTDGTGTAEFVLPSQADGQKEILVRQVDLAGNVSVDSVKLSFTLDTTAPVEVTPSFTFKPLDAGMEISSTVAGKLWVSGPYGDFDLVTTDASKSAIVGTTLIGVQKEMSMGMLLLTPDDGRTIVASNASNSTYVSFGSNGRDDLAGQYLWGYDGNDELSGTSMDDLLSGGAGDDLIHAKGGNDRVIGGKGADTIVLGNDKAVDTIVINAGDTATGPFFGGSIAGMDRIQGADIGDILELGQVFTNTPSVYSTYLMGESANQVAIVRGTDVEGTFSADEFGDVYLLQWADGKDVNSVVLYEYGDGIPALEFDVAGGTMTLALVGIPSNDGEAVG